jgi:hypothetical protein
MTSEKQPGANGALNAEEGQKTAHAEILTQRNRIGEL